MKNKNAFLTSVFCAMLLLLQGCSFFTPFPGSRKSLHNTVLKTIADTMTARPDAALDMIVSLSDTLDEQRLSEAEYYEYQILVAEALYKNDFGQTNDSAVAAAAVFFDSLALRYPKNIDVIFYKARAHYYKGVGEYERELAAEAFGDFLSALEALDMIDYEKAERYDIRHFKALTYIRLASVTSWHEINSISIAFFSLANEIFLKEEMFLSIAQGKYQLASIYNKTGEYSLALSSILEADSLLTLSGRDDSRLRERIARTRAMILYNIGSQDEARGIIISLINSFDDETSMMSCGMLADVYYNEGQYDSAIYYYERYFNMHKFSRMDAARRIIEICDITGDSEKAAQYASYLAEDTADEIALTSVKNEIVAAYGRYLAGREAAKKARLWRMIIVVVAVSAAAVVAVLSLNGMFRKRRHKKEIEKKDVEIESLNREIGDREWLVGVMKGRARSASREAEELKGRMRELEAENAAMRSAMRSAPSPSSAAKPSFKECMSAVMDDATCLRVSAMNDVFVKASGSYPELRLDKATLRHIVDVVDEHLGDIMQDIVLEGYKLKYDDKLLLSLCIIGLDDKHIAAVTGTAYNNVHRRMQRFHEIIGD